MRDSRGSLKQNIVMSFVWVHRYDLRADSRYPPQVMMVAVPRNHFGYSSITVPI